MVVLECSGALGCAQVKGARRQPGMCGRVNKLEYMVYMTARDLEEWMSRLVVWAWWCSKARVGMEP